MFINITNVTIVAIAIVAIMIVYGLVINLEAIAQNKSMNPRAMFILVVVLAIGIAVILDHIDYSKSAPAEVFTNEDVTGAYNAGYNKGVEDSYTTTEDWFSNLQNVTISEDRTTIHLIDSNGEEWVLVSDDYQN
jgi:hypothetical protein|nr:MAG TPA: hypothetical protein [Bacteriophage sp.]